MFNFGGFLNFRFQFTIKNVKCLNDHIEIISSVIQAQTIPLFLIRRFFTYFPEPILNYVPQWCHLGYLISTK
jgi:hypothetical protein